jgi:hypothetical protein
MTVFSRRIFSKKFSQKKNQKNSTISFQVWRILSGLKIFINIFKPDKFLHNSPQNFGDNFVDYFSWQFCGSFCKEKTVNFCQVLVTDRFFHNTSKSFNFTVFNFATAYQNMVCFNFATQCKTKQMNFKLE